MTSPIHLAPSWWHLHNWLLYRVEGTQLTFVGFGTHFHCPGVPLALSPSGPRLSQPTEEVTISIYLFLCSTSGSGEVHHITSSSAGGNRVRGGLCSFLSIDCCWQYLTEYSRLRLWVSGLRAPHLQTLGNISVAESHELLHHLLQLPYTFCQGAKVWVSWQITFLHPILETLGIGNG